MAVTRTDFGSYHSLSGTAGEVLQELSDQSILVHEIVRMADDATFCVYRRGG